MEKNKIKKLGNDILGLLFTIMIAGLAACTSDFENINTNPGGLPPENVPVETRFVQPMQSIYLNYQNKDFEFQLAQNLNADLYSGYLANPTPFNGNNNNSTYAMDEGWNNWIFKVGELYVMKPVSDILKNTELPDYISLAKIIRVAGMVHVTDTYGPVPYSKAMMGGQSIPYDSQEDVYMAFFKELKEAVDSLTLFLETPAAKQTPTRISSFDLMCDGDYVRWIRFANTLRLRLAMRIVKVMPDRAQEEAEAAVAQTYGVLTSADKNIDVKSPLLTNPLQVISFAYNDIRAGAPYVTMLQGYKDPRLGATVKPVGWFKDEDGKVVDIELSDGQNAGKIGQYVGIRQGIVIPDKVNYQMYSVVNMDQKVKVTTKYPLPVMKIAEAYFLRAEGEIRGWNMGGDAKTFYEQGVRQSFLDNGITDAAVYTTYINDDVSLPVAYEDPYNPANNIANENKVTVKWDEAADNETKLQRIITQKWIAMFPEGQEAWSEFRRTGYPKLFPVADNRSDGVIPEGQFIKRLRFTQDEINTNLQAVEEARKLLNGPDNINTRVWWDVDKANF